MDSEFPMNRPERRTSSLDDRKALGADGRREDVPSFAGGDFSRADLTRLAQEANERVAAALSIPRQLICAPVADTWREAVMDQCAIACLDGDFTDPRATLERLITWHVQMALDPKISEAAAAMVLAAKAEALEWAATVCTDEADMAGNQARNGGTAFDDGRELAARELGAEIRAGKGYTS